MWLSEPTETFPITHAVKLYLIFWEVHSGRIKGFYVEMSLNCNIIYSIYIIKKHFLGKLEACPWTQLASLPKILHLHRPTVVIMYT